MHVQDLLPGTRQMVAVAQGDLDRKKSFGAAQVGSMLNYFVVIDLASMQATVPYLR